MIVPKSITLAIVLLLAAAVWGQPPAEQSRNQVFYFTQTASAQGMQEVLTAVRTIASVRDVSLDSAARSLTVRDAAGPSAMAEWLFHELDQSATAPLAAPEAHEYVTPDSSDDVVKVFRLAHTPTQQGLTEMATMIRTIADVPRLFPYGSLHAIAARADAGRMSLAEWLVNELDKPDQQPGVHEMRVSLASGRDHAVTDEIVKVFYPAAIKTPQELTAMVTALRTIADVQRIFPYAGSRAIVLRGQPENAALGEWLFHQLDQPAGSPPPAAQDERAAVNEYWLPGHDDVTRVLFLTHAATPQKLAEIAAAVRTKAGVARIFPYMATHALVLRGAPAQVADAGRLVQERDKP